VKAELSQAGVTTIEVRDFFRDPFSRDELEELVAKDDPKRFFSFRSPSFKKLGLERDSLERDQIISLMLEEPRLIKRPIVEIGDIVILGTDKNLLDRLI
tara:strand:- start:232 stop:528 length:297 start_codon:yes stop_codon:yes gene_type:complete